MLALDGQAPFHPWIVPSSGRPSWGWPAAPFTDVVLNSPSAFVQLYNHGETPMIEIDVSQEVTLVGYCTISGQIFDLPVT